MIPAATRVLVRSGCDLLRSCHIIYKKNKSPHFPEPQYWLETVIAAHFFITVFILSNFRPALPCLPCFLLCRENSKQCADSCDLHKDCSSGGGGCCFPNSPSCTPVVATMINDGMVWVKTMLTCIDQRPPRYVTFDIQEGFRQFPTVGWWPHGLRISVCLFPLVAVVVVTQEWRF